MYTTNISNVESDLLYELISDSKLISSSLVSEGYPSDWDNCSVNRIGITDNKQRIIKEKLNNFVNLSYNYSKKLFGTYYDYLVFFEDYNKTVLNIGGFCGKGSPEVNIKLTNNKCNITMDDIDIKNLVKINRFLIYNNGTSSDIVKMVVYVWS